MERYLISEVAERTGFTPPALRYYEEIGLLPEPRRSPSGYRLYGREDIELLGFIDGAKRLGLSLEEIRDLAPGWSRGDCPSTQAKLEELLELKLRGLHAEIDRLRDSERRLRSARERLLDGSPPERCDVGCGCPPEVDPPLGGARALTRGDGAPAPR